MKLHVFFCLFTIIVSSACDTEQTFQQFSSKQWHGVCFLQAPVRLNASLDFRPIKDLNFYREQYGPYNWTVPPLPAGHRIAVHTEVVQVAKTKTIILRSSQDLDLFTLEYNKNQKGIDLWAVTGDELEGASADQGIISLQSVFGKGETKIGTSEKVGLLHHLKTKLAPTIRQPLTTLTLFNEEGTLMKEILSGEELFFHHFQLAPVLRLHHYLLNQFQDASANKKLTITNLPSQNLTYVPEDLKRYPSAGLTVHSDQYVTLFNSSSIWGERVAQYFFCHLFSRKLSPHVTQPGNPIEKKEEVVDVTTNPQEAFRDDIKEWLETAGMYASNYSAFQEATSLVYTVKVTKTEFEQLMVVQDWLDHSGIYASSFSAYIMAKHLALNQSLSPEAFLRLKQRFSYWESQKIGGAYDSFQRAYKDVLR